MIEVCADNATNVSALSEEASAVVQEISTSLENINLEFEKSIQKHKIIVAMLKKYMHQFNK